MPRLDRSTSAGCPSTVTSCLRTRRLFSVSAIGASVVTLPVISREVARPIRRSDTVTAPAPFRSSSKALRFSGAPPSGSSAHRCPVIA